MKSSLFLSDIAVRNHFKAILSILIDPMRRKLAEACPTLIDMNNLDGSGQTISTKKEAQ